ncbi:hypothetical protein Q3G72_000401 [Acer saccharum]|nr:hypothetical protein Q3G72_000401 [Acer saccharum]
MAIFNNETVEKFSKVVTNVGDEEAVYHANLKLPTGMKITIEPITLTFTGKYQKHNFVLSIETDKEAPGFISIDCGASVDYNDIETSLLYVSDTCMDTGEIHEISPDITSMNPYQQQRKNLRSFPQGTRNCYTLKLKQGGREYLLP